MAEKKAASSGVLSPIEEIVMGVAKGIPYPRLQTWLSAYFHPVETYESNKKDANISAIAIHLALAGLLAAIASLGASVFGLDFFAVVAGLIALVLIPIFAVVFGLIGSAVLYVIAKIVGGKGSYTEQTFALALLYGGYTALSAPFVVLSGIPFLGFLFSLVTTVIVLYCIYDAYLLIKSLHQLSPLRAAIVILVPIVVMAVLFMLFAAALGLAALAGAGMAGGYGAYSGY